MTLARSNQARLAVAGLIVANAALACGPWFVRLAERDALVGPIGSAFWRLALALPILLIAAARVKEPLPKRIAPAFLLAALAGLFFAIDLGAWHIGILHTRLANATLLGNVTALLFPTYGFLIARTWPTRRQGLALALAAVGAVLLMGRSYELSARNLGGDLICLFAGVCYTAYLVVLDRLNGRMGPVTTLTLSVAAGAPVLLAVALATADPLAPRSWTPLVLLAACSQLIGQGLILYAISRVTPLIVGLMLLLQPVVAATIGWVIFGERLGPGDLIGGVAIGAAVLLVRDTRRRLPTGEIGVKPGA